MRYLPIVALLFAAMPALAGEPGGSGAKATAAADAGIRRQLDELEYKYEIDEDGDFKLVFDVDDSKDKRSQLVYVRSPVETYGTHRVREIWSPAYKASGSAFPAGIANRLLEATQQSKLGAWAKQGEYAVFVVKLPADASAEALDNAIEAALRSADAMEAELTPGKDDL